MKKNRSAIGLLLAAALLWGAVPGARSMEAFKNDKLGLDVYGRGQMFGVGEVVPDHMRDHARIYLFLKQARIGFKGHYEDVKFDTQFAFGGEDANGSNTDLGLLDFVADVPIKQLDEDTTVKIGQFRIPYSREGLTDRGTMSFGERSIMNLASFQSRDYGLALQRYKGTCAGTIGVFSAGGRDVPQRYLPERLGSPEVVARFGYNDGVDEDIYHVVGTDTNLKRTTKAAYLNALYMQDTLIGHSTVLNVRTTDKNLLIDPNFNPFINAGPGGAAGTATTLQRGNIYFMGGDAVVRHPFGEGKAVEGEAEVNYGGYQNRFGVLHIASGRVQGDYQFKPFEIGLRYAALIMDKNTEYLSNKVNFSPSMGSVIHEVTPSLTWYIKGHGMKIVADAPIYFNMPVFYDNAVGAYVFADQPAQVSVIGTKGNGTARRTIPEARMLFQFMF